MQNDGKGILGDPKATAEDIRSAWEVAARRALDERERSGEPLVIWDWETSQVVLVSANDFAGVEVPSIADLAVDQSDR